MTGERRLDVCEQCGELLEIKTRIRICTHCIVRLGNGAERDRSAT